MSKQNKSLICALMLFCVVTSNLWAQSEFPLPIKPKGKIQKHFDHNKNGRLELLEREHYKTYRHFGFELVKKKKQKPYDKNKDGMLQPVERMQYERDKANGKIKAVYKEYKSRNKNK